MELFYVNTYSGCGIRKAKDLDSAWSKAYCEVGEDNVVEVRPATEEDIHWVLGMGGYVPKIEEGLSVTS